MTSHLQDSLRSKRSTARAGLAVAAWAIASGGMIMMQANQDSTPYLIEQASAQFRTEQQQSLSIARAIDLDRRANDIARQKQQLDLLVSENPVTIPVLEREEILGLTNAAAADAVGGPLMADTQSTTPRPHMKPSAAQLMTGQMLSFVDKTVQSQTENLSNILTNTLADMNAKFGQITGLTSLGTNPIGWTFAEGEDIDGKLNAIEANQADALIWLHEEIAKATAERVAILRKTGLATSEVFTEISAIVPAILDDNSIQVGGPLIEEATATDIGTNFDAFGSAQNSWNAGTALGDNDRALEQLAALNDVLMALPIRLPTAEDRVWLSSRYGYRRDAFTKHKAFHSGLDLAGGYGTPVKATAEGVVVYASRKGAYGNLVAISHGYGLKTRYAHLSKIDVKVGDVVAVGTQIGRIGSTGRSTGPHLHYEIWHGKNSRDPFPFVDAGRELAKLVPQK